MPNIDVHPYQMKKKFGLMNKFGRIIKGYDEESSARRKLRKLRLYGTDNPYYLVKVKGNTEPALPRSRSDLPGFITKRVR